ncbi:hypothetical protein A0H81_08131 [Grifola frondosa]|uniref:Uncharacterized protein n=1 Tax=Grifola frondosa TaxID=5627 RepID=A0A1C7MAD3_GRIFR|nr:hypothetical protein A0H81_08131 [Grifola frondosa]
MPLANALCHTTLLKRSSTQYSVLSIQLALSLNDVRRSYFRARSLRQRARIQAINIQHVKLWRGIFLSTA